VRQLADRFTSGITLSDAVVTLFVDRYGVFTVKIEKEQDKWFCQLLI